MPESNNENLTGDDGNPTDGTENPPQEGDTPTDGTDPPQGGENPPTDGTDPPQGGENPTEGDTAPGNDMQKILKDLRESLGKKDTDMETLTDSIRSLVDVMSTEAQSDIYVPPDIPIEGYRDWNYPITVEYLVSVVGFDEPVQQSQTYPDADIFLEDYQGFARECFIGSTFKDFYIDRIQDESGNLVYDSQAGIEEPPAEEPAEDLTPAILETLQSIDARLESIDSLSGNTLDYYEDTLKLHEEQNALLTNTLALNMALLFLLVVSFGHKVAHAFWQRMRVG